MSLAKITLDHVALQTSHFDAAIDFYVRILGAELLSRGRFKKREAAWLQIGSGESAVKLELFSRRDGETLAPWTDFTSGPVHLALRVANLDEFLSEAIGKGATFHPSHPTPFTPPVAGARPIAYLLGPDGEEVEIRDE
jgi:catechol 2,3-dioxygenase-like lactoylglutathione lyase family enzyme